MEATIQTEIESVMKLSTADQDPEVLLKACVDKKQMYVDLEFPPGQQSLSRRCDLRQVSKTEWGRPRDFLPAKLKEKVCVFNDVSPDDIDQGALGDCWFLCAVSALAEFPDLTKKLFRHPVSQKQLEKEIKYGAMRVLLNTNGWWTKYIVDTYLPVVGGKPCFAKNIQDPAEQWVSILEKAYAKANGSYSCITAGDALQALTDLTGYPVNRFDTEWDDALTSKAKSQELFDSLVEYDEADYLINLNTPGSDPSFTEGAGGDEEKAANGNGSSSSSSAPKKNGAAVNANAIRLEEPAKVERKVHSVEAYKAAGLCMGHAYSVLTVKRKDGFNLLKIRNPWGGGAEWSGKWGDSSEMWKKHPAVAKACAYDGIIDDGCFWMEWEDVKEYFSGGGVCFSKKSWFDYRVRGSFKGPVPSVALEVTVTKPTSVYFTLTQKDKRSVLPGSDYEYAAMMISLCKNHKDKKMKMHLNSGLDADSPQQRCYFTYQRDQSMLVELKPEDGPYLVVPRCWGTEKDEDRSFVLGIISERSLSAESGISIRFKALEEKSKVFKNMDKFAYVGSQVKDVECECQHTPIMGVPFEKKLLGLGISN